MTQVKRIQLSIVSGTKRDRRRDAADPLGPKSPGTQKAFRDVYAQVSVLELGDEFATLDAGHPDLNCSRKCRRPALKGKTEARILTEWRAVTQSAKGPAPKPGCVQGISGYARDRSK